MHYTTLSDRIEIRLPITTPTEKVRVKRPIYGRAPEPVACRTAPMAEGDYTTVVAFALASVRHHHDMQSVFRCL